MINWESNRPHAGADTLVLLLHGMNCSPKTLESLAGRIQKTLPTAELLIPTLPLRWDRFLDLREVSQEIAEYLTSAMKGRGFRSLILMGHSAGGVLAQSVFLDFQSLADTGRLAVRLILIAPLTRGWRLSHHLPVMHKIAWLIGLGCAWFLEWGESGRAAILASKRRPLWILQLRRGSPFTVALRLKWLAYQGPRPVIYTLLGSVDEIISWHDMIDEVFHHGLVQYREVPYSNHAEIVDIDHKEHGAERAAIIAGALTEDPAQALPHQNFAPWDLPPSPPNPNVERMVFVMHGIRDEGHWTQKIAARARTLFKPESPLGEIAVETSSYGYFSMLEFLLPAARRKKIHWLMDEYVEARRSFPNARFSYIGHSNGTYLLAQALKEYPQVRFDRIAFAGSVVSSRYDWQSLIANGQVGHVLNFTAHQDIVVSFFPRLADILPPLQALIGPNLGGAGVVPFPTSKQVQSNSHVIGGHGSAIGEWNWNHLARYAVSPDSPVLPPEDPREDHHYTDRPHWTCASWVSLAVLFILLNGLVCLGYLAWLNPLFFWILPAAFLSTGGVLIAWHAGRADGQVFEHRETILRQAGWILGAVVLASAAWFLLPVALLNLQVLNLNRDFAGLLASWKNFPNLPPGTVSAQNHEILHSLRTLSVLAYVWGLHKILTKV